MAVGDIDIAKFDENVFHKGNSDSSVTVKLAALFTTALFDDLEYNVENVSGGGNRNNIVVTVTGVRIA